MFQIAGLVHRSSNEWLVRVHVLPQLLRASDPFLHGSHDNRGQERPPETARGLVSVRQRSTTVLHAGKDLEEPSARPTTEITHEWTHRQDIHALNRETMRNQSLANNGTGINYRGLRR